MVFSNSFTGAMCLPLCLLCLCRQVLPEMVKTSYYIAPHASLGNETYPPCRLTFLTGLWFGSLLQPNSGPDHIKTPVSKGPDCHAHKDLILVLYTLTLFLSRHWFCSSLDPILVHSMGLNLVLSTSWIWSSIQSDSGLTVQLFAWPLPEILF